MMAETIDTRAGIAEIDQRLAAVNADIAATRKKITPLRFLAEFSSSKAEEKDKLTASLALMEARQKELVEAREAALLQRDMEDDDKRQAIVDRHAAARARDLEDARQMSRKAAEDLAAAFRAFVAASRVIAAYEGRVAPEYHEQLGMLPRRMITALRNALQPLGHLNHFEIKDSIDHWYDLRGTEAIDLFLDLTKEPAS